VSIRWRVAVSLTGLVVLLASLAVLAYVFWPIKIATEQLRPAPTLFVPPESMAGVARLL
jgi:hypothetical protein